MACAALTASQKLRLRSDAMSAPASAGCVSPRTNWGPWCLAFGPVEDPRRDEWPLLRRFGRRPRSSGGTLPSVELLLRLARPEDRRRRKLDGPPEPSPTAHTALSEAEGSPRRRADGSSERTGVPASASSSNLRGRDACGGSQT